MSRGRPQKVADLIQRELSDLLRREVRDPRVGMVTLTSVDVAPDLSHAKVFFTLLDKGRQADTAKALQRAAGFLRSKLSHRMNMYTTPELRFVYDESVERGDRLSRLIDSVVPPEALMRGKPRRKLDGVLLLDKPVGPSSSAVLQAVKRLLEAEKAGHAGTLDPLASGLLPLLFGEATKFAQFGLDSIKEYRAQVRLGMSTDTGDAEGKVLERHPVEVDQAALEQALARFRGAIEQVPPMYSALKHAGQPLYALARAGQTVERAARQVTVYELELLERAGDVLHGGDVLHLRIKCSKGTYVRQLAADLGLALGTVAHLAALRRTAVARFRLDQAVTLEDFQALGEESRLAWLLPPDRLLQDLPRLDLPEDLAGRFLNGQAVALAAAGQGPCRVYDNAGVLLGVGEGGPGAALRPARLIARA